MNSNTEEKQVGSLNKRKKIIMLSLIVLFSTITILMLTVFDTPSKKEMIEQSKIALEKKYEEKFDYVDFKKTPKNVKDVHYIEFKNAKKELNNQTFIVAYYNEDKIYDYYNQFLWKQEIQADFQDAVSELFGQDTYVFGYANSDKQKTVGQKPISYKETKDDSFTMVLSVSKKYKESKRLEEKILSYATSIPNNFAKLEVYFNGKNEMVQKIEMPLKNKDGKKLKEKELKKSLKVEDVKTKKL